MKKKFFIIIILFLILCPYIEKTTDYSKNLQSSISKKIIRFHVIANSDSETDQNLKLKVRDNILAFLSPKLSKSKSIEESREIISENNDRINSIALGVVKQNGFNYPVTTKLSFENFPQKTYGDLTFPQGRYEAYRVILGSGSGHNWWCVMFPPLCFNDMTVENLEKTKGKKNDCSMNNLLTDDEMKFIQNPYANDYKKGIKIKFKTVEIIKKIIKQIR